MNILQHVLASVGIGNAHLFLSLPATAYRQGSLIEGIVAVEGGSVEQHIKSIQVGVGISSIERIYWLQKICIARDVAVSPQNREEYPFQIRLSETAGLTENTLLCAEADIAWATKPCVQQKLHILPCREAQAVVEALLHLGFTETPSHHSGLSHYSGLNYDLDKRFAPPNDLQDLLYEARLQLLIWEKMLRGLLIVTYRDIKTYGTPHRNFLLTWQRSELLTLQGEGNPQAALPALTAILEKAKIAPPSEKDWLLRASSAPNDAKAILLRPAEASPNTTPPEELLRPSEKQEG